MMNEINYILNEIDSTKRIQSKIDEIHSYGGGILKICRGEYKIGTIELKSNITLFLETGSILKAHDDLENFKEIGYFHNEMGNVRSIIYCMNGENIHIEGNGKIDLNGTIHFDQNRPNIKNDKAEFMTMEQIQEAPWKFDGRINQPIFFKSCKNVTVKGIEIINSPCWTLTFVECINLLMNSIIINNHPNIPNNDGMHFCSCKDVIISDCNINAADDCIAISAITDWNKPSENFVITNCILRSFSKALSIGYMHSIIKNVMISNCNILSSNRGFSIMSSSSSGYVENVNVTNCHFETKVRSGAWWGNGEPIYIMGLYHHSYTQTVDRNWDINVRNINFSNITCSSENAIAIIGNNHNIENINFRDITIEIKESDNLNIKGKIVDLEPAKQIPTLPEDDKIYYYAAIDCKDITITNMKAYGFTNDLYKYEKDIINTQI